MFVTQLGTKCEIFLFFLHVRRRCFLKVFVWDSAEKPMHWATRDGCRNLVINTLRTGDADLRFYVTTVQEG